jgi:hypothetical protein
MSKETFYNLRAMTLTTTRDMVRERARDMKEDDLQLMGWLLGLETDRSVDGLSNSRCKFLCSRPNGERDGVSSTTSNVRERSFQRRSVAETLMIEDIWKKIMQLQEEEDEGTCLDEKNDVAWPT